MNAEQLTALRLMGVEPVCLTCDHARKFAGQLVKGKLVCLVGNEFIESSTPACNSYEPTTFVDPKKVATTLMGYTPHCAICEHWYVSKAYDEATRCLVTGEVQWDPNHTCAGFHKDTNKEFK